MNNDLQPPISPKMQNRNDTESDYVYDNAKDEGRVHRPLIGGRWVTHYEMRIAYKLGHFAAFPTTSARLARGRMRRLQCDMIKLEIARRGFYIKEVQRLDPENKTHRLCKIGVSNHEAQ